MSTTLASTERRDAIKRAHAAAVRLAIYPDLREVIHTHLRIVNNNGCVPFSDREAWDSVQALEAVLTQRANRPTYSHQ